MATLFEAPIAHEAHEATHFSPEANEWPRAQEWEDEWEAHEATHFSPEAHEWEDEWEAHEATHFSPEAHEWEDEWEAHEAAHYSPETNEWPRAQEWEDEWEVFEHPEAHEWETHEAAHYSPEAHEWESTNEWEDEWEADQFLGGAFRKLGRLAKRFAPSIVGKLAGMIPGVGALAGPLASKLTQQLVREGEMEAAQTEAHLFGTNEANPEVGAHEISHEAALTEMLASEAAAASTEAEAASVLSAALPLTIRIMGGQRSLRPVLPALAQANGALVQSMRRQGPAGRQLLRTVPAIQRQAVATMRAAARRGQPMTTPLAVKAMAASTERVLNNPRRVDIIINRNAALRPRVAPMTSRRQFSPTSMRPVPYSPRRAPSTYRRIAG